MPAATLLCDTSAPPAPVYPLAPSYQVTIGGQVVPGALVQSIDLPGLSTVGGCEVLFPRTVTVRGVTFANPAWDTLTVAAELVIVRDGVDVIFVGPVVQPPDVDFLAGWVKVTAKDGPEHAARVNHGVGKNTGWTGKQVSTDPDEEDPTDPLVTGYTALNATLTGPLSPWGIAVGVAYGPDHGGNAKAQAARYHAAVHTFVLGEFDRLELNAIVRPAKGASKVKFVQMNRVNPDLPKAHQDVSVSMPTGLADEKWCEPFGLATVEGPGKVNVAIWSPMPGRGFNAAAIRWKVTSTKEKPPDPTDPTEVRVPVGGSSTEMVTHLYNAAFSIAGGYHAVDVGGGYVFTDGMAIEDDNLGTYASLAEQWRSTTEWLWDPAGRTVYVYGVGDAGQFWPGLRTQVEGQARAHAIALQGATKVPVARVTVTAQDDTRGSFAFTYVDPDLPPWDDVETAPTGMDPAAFAEQIQAQPRSAQPVTVVVVAPHGGRSPGDWWREGVRCGDRVPVHIDAGAWSNHDTLRITGMRLEPNDGDKLTLTLEPV